MLSAILVSSQIFLFEPGLKLDEKSIENGLEGQKCLVMSLFSKNCIISIVCGVNFNFSSNILIDKPMKMLKKQVKPHILTAAVWLLFMLM